MLIIEAGMERQDGRRREHEDCWDWFDTDFPGPCSTGKGGATRPWSGGMSMSQGWSSIHQLDSFNTRLSL